VKSDSSALAIRPTDQVSVDDHRLQQVWIATQKRPWRSLALLSGSSGVPTLGTANLFAKISWAYSGTPSAVFDLRDVSLRLLEHHAQNVQLQIQHGERVFIALRAASENPTAIPLARMADAVILCIALGKTTTKSASEVMAAVGKERFLGSIVVDPSSEPTEARAEGGP
jgi:hypothetical protein